MRLVYADILHRYLLYLVIYSCFFFKAIQFSKVFKYYLCQKEVLFANRNGRKRQLNITNTTAHTKYSLPLPNVYNNIVKCSISRKKPYTSIIILLLLLYNVQTSITSIIYMISYLKVFYLDKSQVAISQQSHPFSVSSPIRYFTDAV